jgi:Uma2 family endonuclease
VESTLGFEASSPQLWSVAKTSKPLSAVLSTRNAVHLRFISPKAAIRYLCGGRTPFAQLRGLLARGEENGYPSKEFQVMAMPMSDRIRPLYRDEYYRLAEFGAFEDERIELLEGELVRMSPPGAPHSATIQVLNRLFLPRLLERAEVRIQLPFDAAETSQPQPDVALVPLDTYRTAHPAKAYLLIEVAESSLGYDQGKKQRIYARARVPEYWIVNIPDECIEVYRQPGLSGYDKCELVPRSGSIAPLEFPDVVIRVADVLG